MTKSGCFGAAGEAGAVVAAGSTGTAPEAEMPAGAAEAARDFGRGIALRLTETNANEAGAQVVLETA